MKVENFDPKESAVITLTPAAVEHFAKVVQAADAQGVRLSLKGGGCAGFQYQWDLISDMSEIQLQDYFVLQDGWTFWLDSKSTDFLTGSVVDLKTGIAGQYVDIFAPLASSSCGCGESVTFTL